MTSCQQNDHRTSYQVYLTKPPQSIPVIPPPTSPPIYAVTYTAYTWLCGVIINQPSHWAAYVHT